MLTDRELTDARRFCGYPAVGSGAAGAMGWQYYQAYGALEFRLANLSDPEAVVVRQYLATLRALEAAVPAASENLDTAEAAVWRRNANEVEDRLRLLDTWSDRLCAFLGVPRGDAGQRGGTATLVV